MAVTLPPWDPRRAQAQWAKCACGDLVLEHETSWRGRGQCLAVLANGRMCPCKGPR